MLKKIILWFRSSVVCGVGLVYWIFKYEILKLLWGRKVAASKITSMNQLVLPKFLRFKGSKIGKGTTINEGFVLLNLRSFGNLTIGNNVHIGYGCVFDLREKINIQDNAVVSMGVRIVTHMDISNSDLSSIYPAESASVTIQKNSYIGAGSTILMGVNVGENH